MEPRAVPRGAEPVTENIDEARPKNKAEVNGGTEAQHAIIEPPVCDRTGGAKPLTGPMKYI